MIAEALVAFTTSMLTSKWDRRGVYVKFHLVAAATAATAKYLGSGPLSAFIGAFLGVLFTDLLLCPRGTGKAGWFDALYVTPILSALLSILAA